jgi:glycerate dehydrogenase
MLHFASSVNAHDTRVHSRDWVNSPDFSFTCAPLFELSGKTLGIIGLGDIGQSVAKLAQAFGMKVLGHSRTPKNLDGIRDVELSELLRDSDFISLHCPLTDNTKNLINVKNIELMKPTAYLINTSRGPTIHEQDLADALNSGKIAGAGLDVLSSEPPKVDNPLLTAKNCVITPHIAWATFEARQRLMAITEDNLRSFMTGDVKNVVNP